MAEEIKRQIRFTRQQISTLELWRRFNTPERGLLFYFDTWERGPSSCVWEPMRISRATVWKTITKFAILPNRLNADPPNDFPESQDLTLWKRFLDDRTQRDEWGIAYPIHFQMQGLKCLVIVTNPRATQEEYRSFFQEWSDLALQYTSSLELVAVEEHQGPRPHMEDTWIKVVFDEWTMYAVFDGHGGKQVSTKLAHEKDGLAPFLIKYLKAVDKKATANVLTKAIVEYDQTVLAPLKYAQTCGSTCVMIIKSNHSPDAWIVHLGDARCIVMNRDTGQLVLSTRDHKPNDPVEEKRIKEAGGSVNNVNGIYRTGVPGYDFQLSLARAFGDWGAKLYRGTPDAIKGAITSVPDVKHIQLSSQHDVILACDGLWDGIDFDQLKRIVCDNPSFTTPRLLSAAIKHAYKKSTDNITAMWLRIE